MVSLILRESYISVRDSAISVTLNERESLHLSKRLSNTSDLGWENVFVNKNQEGGWGYPKS